MSDFNFYVSPNGKLVRVTNSSANSSDEAKAVPGGSERYAVNWNEFDGLMGRMLTIVDAAFADPEQRQAVKRLVRNGIKDWVADIAQAALADESRDGDHSECLGGGRYCAAEPEATASTSFAAPDKAAA